MKNFWKKLGLKLAQAIFDGAMGGANKFFKKHGCNPDFNENGVNDIQEAQTMVDKIIEKTIEELDKIVEHENNEVK